MAEKRPIQVREQNQAPQTHPGAAASNVEPRKRLPSHADLDAAEARANALKSLMEDERRRADELQQQIEAERAAHARRLVVTAEPAPKASIPPANIVTVHGKGWKYGISFATLAVVGPIALTVFSQITSFVTQWREQTAYIRGVADHFTKIDNDLEAIKKENAVLRETVARQAGFAVGVMAKAGVNVAGTEPGGIMVEVQSDPLPPGVKPRAKVNVTTRVPAPPPKPK